MKKFIKGFLLVLLIAVVIFSTKLVIEMAASNRKKTLNTKDNEISKKSDLLIGYENYSDVVVLEADSYLYPVPIINQMADPPLLYGCEVTALSMLLQYYHFDYTKNDLAEKIAKESYEIEAGIYGDPDLGFVGDMTGENAGTAVNAGPIYELADSIVTSPYEVINSTGTDVSELLEIVKEGNPIWVIVTADFQVPKDSDFMDWPTKNGKKQFTKKHHAAVISGFDETHIYLNDPYGTIQKIDLDVFEQLFEKMGKQSVYIK